MGKSILCTVTCNSKLEDGGVFVPYTYGSNPRWQHLSCIQNIFQKDKIERTFRRCRFIYNLMVVKIIEVIKLLSIIVFRCHSVQTERSRTVSIINF